MEFFAALMAIAQSPDPKAKLAALYQLDAALEENRVVFDHDAAVQPVAAPSYAAFCTIVHGAKVVRRRNLGTRHGRGAFLHALAHIEYSAIDLALDSCYRFRHLPVQFYEDFFRIALDEARHFSRLSQLLAELDFCYGDFPVHTGIYDAMLRSAHSLRVRMAATHRHLEANGLDAHPELERKIRLFSDGHAKQIAAALQEIYHDEITHVAAGDFWFRYACGRDGVLPQDNFISDVQAAIPGAKFPKPHINRRARLAAGFSAVELAALG